MSFHCFNDVPESFLSSQRHKPFKSESSEISSIPVMTWPSQSRVTRTVESLRVIGFQARVNVVSKEIWHYCCVFLLWNGARWVREWYL